MPELPEIYNIANQMNKELSGKKLIYTDIKQEKCLNVTVEEFEGLVLHKTIESVTSRGKWIFVKLEQDAYLLLSLGMGADMYYNKGNETMPEKYQIMFTFDNGSSLAIRFWWFGYVHAVKAVQLKEHKMTAKLGLSPLSDSEFTYENFQRMLKGKKGSIKSLLMKQEYIAGIGNVYIQDILFRAKLHPNRKITEISEDEVKGLFEAIKNNLREATLLGGLAYEKDLYGQAGRFKAFRVGYHEGEACPDCGTLIEKIKTGSTSTYICAQCQR